MEKRQAVKKVFCTSLRYPGKLRREIQEHAAKEGLSANSATLQLIRWGLKFKEQMDA